MCLDYLTFTFASFLFYEEMSMEISFCIHYFAFIQLLVGSKHNLWVFKYTFYSFQNLMIVRGNKYYWDLSFSIANANKLHFFFAMNLSHVTWCPFKRTNYLPFQVGQISPPNKKRVILRCMNVPWPLSSNKCLHEKISV